MHASSRLSTRWSFGLKLLGGIRHCTFLPALVATVPRLVLYNGGDALNVCLTTVALLFLADVDNAAFAIGLSERIRTRVEEFGRVDLSSTQAKALVQSKAAHVCLISSAIVLAVVSQHDDTILLLSYLAFWLGGVVEAFALSDKPVEIFRRTAELTGALCLGVVFLFVTYIIAGG